MCNNICRFTNMMKRNILKMINWILIAKNETSNLWFVWNHRITFLNDRSRVALSYDARNTFLDPLINSLKTCKPLSSKRRANSTMNNRFRSQNHTLGVTTHKTRTEDTLILIKRTVKVNFDEWVRWGMPNNHFQKQGMIFNPHNI